MMRKWKVFDAAMLEEAKTDIKLLIGKRKEE